jgi:hypothetical protein
MATDALDPADVLRALRGGVATLEALRGRLGGADRDQLAWVLDDLAAQGLVQVSGAWDCGPNGLCGTSAPATAVLSAAGRAAACRAQEQRGDRAEPVEAP